MKIPHLTHPEQSVFYPIVLSALRTEKNQLPISVSLKEEGGYDGDRRITLQSQDDLEFEADVELEDWTRFPARIRAAATAIRDSGLTGLFRITHSNGVLTLA